MEDPFDLPRQNPFAQDEAVPPVVPGGGSYGDEVSVVDRYSLFEQTLRGVKFGRLGIVLPPGTLYEVVESANLTPLPGVKPLFKGFVTHRSNVAPVYDLAELTGEAHPAWERKRVLILNSGREAVAVLLYELPFQIRSETRIDSDRTDDVPDIFRRHTRDAYRSHGTLWLALDYEGFFTELSTLCLETDFETDWSGSADAGPPTPTLEY